MRYLTVEEVLIIHELELRKHGGSPGIKSLSLLESSVYRPTTSFGGKVLYPSIFEKAASLIHSITINHPFLDGNKRTAIVSGITFLALNGYAFLSSQEELVGIMLGIASSGISQEDLSKFLEEHSKLSG